MLPGDDLAAAREAAGLVRDPRAHHFYDAERRVGQAVASSLGREGAAGQTAWDMYLFYNKGARWPSASDGAAVAPPRPTDWLHQLRGRVWADPQRWRWGEALAAALLET